MFYVNSLMLVSLKGNSIRAARGTSVLPILSPGSSSSNQDWVVEAEAWSSLSKHSSDSRQSMPVALSFMFPLSPKEDILCSSFSPAFS